MVYIFLLLFMILLSIMYSASKKKIYIIFMIIPLIIISAFRYHVGIDYEAYELIYKKIASGSQIGDSLVPKEYGYFYLVKAIIFFGGTQQLVFLIFSFITVIMIYKYIKGNSSNYANSLLIYIFLGPFYLGSFNLMRQAAAVALFAYATKYIEKKSFSKYILIILFGGIFFHSSIIVMIPFYFILQIKYSTVKRILVVILVALSTKLIIYFLTLSAYSVYLKMKFDNTSKLTFYVYLLITLICFFTSVVLMEKSRKNTILLNLIFFSALIQLLPLLNAEIPTELVYRVNYYFFISIIVILPICLDKITNKYKKIFFKISLIIFLMLIFMRTTIIEGESNKLLPYKINIELTNIRYGD